MGKAFDPERYNSLLSAESYLREINQVPLLTPEEEFKLAARERTVDLTEIVEALQTEIVERKRIQGELEKSEERFRSLVEQVKDYAIFSTDVQGNITSWNSGGERIYGHRAEEIPISPPQTKIFDKPNLFGYFPISYRIGTVLAVLRVGLTFGNPKRPQ